MRLARALTHQAEACRSLGSAFMHRLLCLLADALPRDSPLYSKVESWPGDLGPSGRSVPLRLAGGLHALVISGADPKLAAVYPPNAAPDAVFAGAVLGALERNAAFLLDWIDRPPQTNEVRRAAPLIAAAHRLAGLYPLPFILSELGASAGLNLMFDRFALVAGGQRLGPQDPVLTLTPDWTGPVPDKADLQVSDRRGVDLTPLDVADPGDITRLFACLWPDQPDRRDLTRRAIAAFDANVDAADAVDWLAKRLASPTPGHLHLIYHTIAWQYFPADAQRRGREILESAGHRATDHAPLAWLAMEADDAGPGAGLTLRIWPGNRAIALGRADFHGRWVIWNAG
ncbi:MAG: DUF2332 domain-containing protein [Marinibacterium sp.]